MGCFVVPPLLNDLLGGKLLAPLGVLLSLCLGLVARFGWQLGYAGFALAARLEEKKQLWT